MGSCLIPDNVSIIFHLQNFTVFPNRLVPFFSVGGIIISFVFADILVDWKLWRTDMVMPKH